MQEFCDGGCLADAIRQGVFRDKDRDKEHSGSTSREQMQMQVSGPWGEHRPHTSGVGATSPPAERPNMYFIYLTLLEVAMALKYLHAINLVHRVSGGSVLTRCVPR